MLRDGRILSILKKDLGTNGRIGEAVDVDGIKDDIKEDIRGGISDEIRSEIDNISIPAGFQPGKTLSASINPNQDILPSADKVLAIASSNVADVSDEYEIVDGSKIRVANSGEYRVDYNVTITPNPTGDRAVFVAKNGSFAPTVSGMNGALMVKSSTPFTDTVHFYNNAVTNTPQDTWRTMEFWYKPSNYGDQASPASTAQQGNMIMAMGLSAWDNRGVCIAQASDGTLRVGAITDAGTGYTLRTISPAVSLNEWHHVALVFRFTALSSPFRLRFNYRIYIDGVMRREETPDVNVNTGQTGAKNGFTVKLGNSTAVYMLDDVRISTNARYSGATITVPTGQLSKDANTAALYTMDDYDIASPITVDGSQVIAEISDAAKNMTLNANNGYATTSPLEFGYAQSFPSDMIPRYAEVLVPAAAGKMPTVVSSSQAIRLAAGDFVQLVTWQNSGATLLPFGRARLSNISIQRVSE